MAGIDEVQVSAEDDYAFEGHIADDGMIVGVISVGVCYVIFVNHCSC